MCGINGILEFRPGPAPALAAAIDKMNAAIAHRGPDGHGSYLAPGIGLGHRRLSIIDLTDAASQPMASDDGSLVLVFNGEIYNYLELIPELRAAGHRFRSRSDTEVILRAYEQWGEDCVSRFNGMWAFALWDARRQRLFMSRDRFGVKPLYYSLEAGRLVFSSEPAGIRAARPCHLANLSKLHAYLAYGYRTNNGDTFFEGMNELMPGHVASVSADAGMRIRRYWRLGDAQPDLPPPSQWVERYRALLDDALRLRFRSDVPVALLQSGGLDSSSLCVLVNDAIATRRLTVQQVTAFTAVHPGHSSDESHAVRQLMATCPHIRSIEVQPGGQDLGESLPDFVAAMQEPVFSTTSYAHWRLMSAVRANGTKVVINGQGADEALAGYTRYIMGYRLLDLLLSAPSAVLREARAMHDVLGASYSQLLSQTAKAMLGRRWASSVRARFTERTLQVLAPEWTRSQRQYLPDVPMTWGDGNLRRHLVSQLEHYGFNQILHYEDQSSMSQSIEIRSPFIDFRLMEFAFALPAQALFSGGVSKRILRDAFRPRLPADIVDGHRKIGFATPFEVWSAQPSFRKRVEEIVTSPEFRARSIWQADRLGPKLLDATAIEQGFPAWRFINAEIWLRQNGITNA